MVTSVACAAMAAAATAMLFHDNVDRAGHNRHFVGDAHRLFSEQIKPSQKCCNDQRRA